MLYEIMNQIKANGSINSQEISELLGKFEDLNSQKTVSQCTTSDYTKYVSFGLEALQETMERHKEGRYQNLNPAKKAYGAGSGHKFSGEDFSLQFS